MKQANVLLIEDNPGDADLIRLRLMEGKSDVDVSCVNRLSDAFTSMENKLPSVVLLDLNLPDSRGAETFRRVLGKVPGVPVVVLSGQDDEELAVKAVHQRPAQSQLHGLPSAGKLGQLPGIPPAFRHHLHSARSTCEIQGQLRTGRFRRHITRGRTDHAQQHASQRFSRALEGR